MDFVLALHSHLPYVLNHGRWPHGSDWLCEATMDTYLPLLENLETLRRLNVAAPVTLGITPILANQLAHPTFVREMDAFFDQRIAACDEDEAAFAQSGEDELLPLAAFWRERVGRLRRIFDRWDGNLLAAFRRLASEGRVELMSSAATHGFLPLLARDESIRLQLHVGQSEHRRLFGAPPAGCWVPECAYRRGGMWQPLPSAPRQEFRPPIEDHLREAGFRYFFVDSHLAQAGRSLGLYGESHFAGGIVEPDRRWVDTPSMRSPYRAYVVSPRPGAATVSAFVRDPISSLQVWSRYHGYPGDGIYLEFHKIRFPGGLKFWRVTDSDIDLGLKEPYDPNTSRARAHRHARHWGEMIQSVAAKAAGDAAEVVVAPFDSELFGHWWFEGVDFLSDFYRALHRQPGIVPTTASGHLSRQSANVAVELAEGSWGANGDFRKWLNPATEWTWERLWPLEQDFWTLAPLALNDPTGRIVLAQATREMLLAQASDWQFIISTGAAADYAERRFVEHCRDAEVLLDALRSNNPDAIAAAARFAETVHQRDDVFPNVLTDVEAVLHGRGD